MHYYGGKKGENKEDPRRLVDEIIGEIKKDVPKWNELLGENGKVERLVREKSFKNLNPTQIRKFFDQVKKIEANLEGGWNPRLDAELWRLVPSIKYAAGRGNVPEEFAYFVSSAVEAIDSSENKETVFNNFERVFEAIVAYHKYYRR